MAKFIKVTDLSGAIIYINVYHILSVYGTMNTYLQHGVEGLFTTVKETKEEVMELIRNA